MRWAMVAVVWMFLAAPAAAAGLDALDGMVGHCWQGELKDAGSIDTHCWRSALDGQYVVDAHVVRGKTPDYSGDTYFRWNKDKGVIEFWYFNSLGEVSKGTATPVEGGLDFPEERYEGEDGTRVFRSRLRWHDAAHYRMVTEEQTAEGWREFMAVDFSRVPAQ